MRNILFIFLVTFCFTQVLAQDVNAKVLNPWQESSSPSNDSIFTFVEELPEFPGGDVELVKFIYANLKYEKVKKKKYESVKVQVRFVVDEHGNVINPVVTKSISAELDAEAVRVVSLLPQFKPGKNKGKPVKFYYTVPVVFKL